MSSVKEFIVLKVITVPCNFGPCETLKDRNGVIGDPFHGAEPFRNANEMQDKVMITSEGIKAALAFTASWNIYGVNKIISTDIIVRKDGRECVICQVKMSLGIKITRMPYQVLVIMVEMDTYCFYNL
ncbi:hypothetical protein PsorP6_011773 [Peronosclerospora sorghi]|uniref:Uncharacterized protein n=1 Tax=Peronosclerospora sorghi TaxID=230839 RepID=A0ACC0WJH5_9STRA|nr:hypothetical protein PsorP6_011773 [Peronosclerospora sorghi]